MDGRGSKGSCHLFNKFNIEHPSNVFVAEYAERPPLARIFYEDVLQASVFFGYPLLIENNKYGIFRYFEARGYDGFILDRPEHLRAPHSNANIKTKGIPSNSQRGGAIKKREEVHRMAEANKAFSHYRF